MQPRDRRRTFSGTGADNGECPASAKEAAAKNRVEETPAGQIKCRSTRHQLFLPGLDSLLDYVPKRRFSRPIQHLCSISLEIRANDLNHRFDLRNFSTSPDRDLPCLPHVRRPNTLPVETEATTCPSTANE
jgi:hypothetical protein